MSLSLVQMFKHDLERMLKDAEINLEAAERNLADASHRYSLAQAHHWRLQQILRENELAEGDSESA